jgi:maltose O-acetyltransferase
MTETDDPRIVELKAMGAHIGDDVFLGADVYIERDFAPLLTIEDGVVLARGVTILLHDSALNNVANEPLKFGRVVLHARCYVGANATILCGVEIGARSVVGACSLVTKDVPPGTVVAGQPARVTGSVADMIDKHKRERGNPRFGYLPLPAWRDRRHNPEQMQAAERIIGQFIRNFGNEH